MTNTVNDLLQQGLQAHSQGDLDGAASAYQAALDLNPDSASAHNRTDQARARAPSKRAKVLSPVAPPVEMERLMVLY